MFYLVRHGQTEFNAQLRIQGGQDSPLTALGRDQARRVGLTLRDIVSNGEDWEIVASPLGRTRHTAEILREAAGLTAPLQFDERLVELHCGEWEGMTGEDIDRVYPGARDGLGRWDWWFAAPGGEPRAAFTARLTGWLAEAATREKPLIVVSHGIVSRCLRSLYGGIAWEDLPVGPTPQDSFFHFQGGRIVQIASVRAG